MTNSLTLYGLATAEGQQANVSPYAWKTAIDLGLLRIPYQWDGKTFEEIRTSFEEHTGVPGILVPAIQDGGEWVWDSFKIAQHLDAKYGPRLFADGEDAARSLDEWADKELRAALAPLLLPWLYAAQEPASQALFVKIKLGGNAAFITQLTAALAQPDYIATQAANIRAALQTIEARLRDAPFLAGDAPGHADAAVWGWYATSRAIALDGLDVEAMVWRHAELPRVGAWVDAVQDAAGVELALP